MSRPVLYAELNGVDSLVSGWLSRDLFLRVRGRAPMYVSRRGGYACQERTARDIVALAESMGHDVVITGSRATRSSTHEAQVSELRDEDLGAGDTEVVEADGVLW